MFWTEGISLGVVGWLLGIVVGIPVAHDFVQVLGSPLVEVPFVFNPVSLVYMLLL